MLEIINLRIFWVLCLMFVQLQGHPLDDAQPSTVISTIQEPSAPTTFGLLSLTSELLQSPASPISISKSQATTPFATTLNVALTNGSFTSVLSTSVASLLPSSTSTGPNPVNGGFPTDLSVKLAVGIVIPVALVLGIVLWWRWPKRWQRTKYTSVGQTIVVQEKPPEERPPPPDNTPATGRSGSPARSAQFRGAGGKANSQNVRRSST